MTRFSVEAAAERLRRRANLAAYLGDLFRHGAIALVAAGSLALALRFFAHASRETAALGLVLLVAIAPATAFVAARRRFLSPAGAAAWLDVRSGGTGLLLARGESGDARWDSAVAPVGGRVARPPRVRLRALLAPLLPSLAFAIAAFVVPVPAPRFVVRPLSESLIERLREKLAALEETVDIDPAVEEELEKRLEWLESGAGNARPETAYEAADRFAQRLEAEAAKARASAERALSSLAAAARRDEAAERSEAARAALEELRASGLATGEMAGLEIPEGLILSEADLAQLARDLSSFLEGPLSTLAGAGLLGAPGAGELPVPAEFFEECDGSCGSEPGEG